MKKAKLALLFLLFLMGVYGANAVSIGISPGRVRFDSVLREGYSERTVTITTSTDGELLTSFKPGGEIAPWIRFEPNVTSFTMTRETPYRLKIIAEPPPDIRIGNYSGSIEFVTEGIGGVEGRAGAFIKTAVTLLVNLGMTGEEIIKCRAGGFDFDDAEVGFPLNLEATVANDGNVRLAPIITLDIWDQLQENLLFTRDVAGDEVLPTTERRIVKSIPNSLSEGQYWVNMKVNECHAGSFHTFSIVEKGGIVDRGDIKEMSNKPWAYTNETIQFKVKFQNSGSRPVAAKFKGTIRLDDTIVKLVETDEIIVPAGEIADFDVFFTPEVPGRYTLTGRVIYNKKLTFEKGTVLNVNPAPEYIEVKKASYLPLLLYLIIIITIICLVRKIVKERKRRRPF